ncbi:MAG TPA: alpha/beta fold hydrolase [Gaiellaceae bacterium]|nr:alpha/beta fold hydrolase [Gaiellaceae bacterium]
MDPQRHRYGAARSRFGELFLPVGDGPHPVAVLLHGGFWRRRYDRTLMEPLCRDLAAGGWAAWNLEYRRLGILAGGGWPETFEDVAAGIDHLERLPALDLDRVVAVGHSAGGQLALWAAARERAAVGVTHAVSQAGVVDVREASRLRLSRGAAARLLGGSPGRRPERYAAASPIERLPLGVPQLLVHGEEDAIVPVSMSLRYHDAALAAGDAVELVVLPGTGHYEHLDPGSDAWAAVIDWLPALA